GGPDLGLYPSMYVDVDIALSLAEAGWNVMVEPRSIVGHAGSASTPSSLHSYLLASHRRRVARRHAALLRDHEPFDPAPASIARALERCAATADERRTRRAFTTPARPEP